MLKLINPRIRPAVVLLLCGVLSACTTTHYRESADKEVYGILDEKSAQVPGMVEQDLTIEPPDALDYAAYSKNEEVAEYLGEADAQAEMGASIISLEDALSIAFSHSREYQSRKEQLYLTALRLTLDRHEFQPIFSGRVTATHVWGAEDVSTGTLISAVDTMAGAPGDLLRNYAGVVQDSGAMTRGVGGGTDVDRTRSIEGSTSFGMDALFRGGGRLAINLTSNFFRFLSGPSEESASSAISATFVQPLLQGRGRAVNMEFLTQSERDVLYALRDFTQFRMDFAVRVASQYYGVLRARDAAHNNYLGLKSFELSLEREQAFQLEGLRTSADVARLRQSKLSRDLSWTNSVRGYKQNLDSFKILLGIPTDTAIVLDPAELDALKESGSRIPAITPEEAVEVALVSRLDLYNDRDSVDDATRRIKVAANLLQPGLDLVLTGDVPSEGNNRFASFDFERSEWSAGAVLDLPLDRKAERNNYRSALIDYERATRDASLAEDNVKLEVRNSFRDLVQAQKDYEINQISVELNESRVEEEELRAELGLGDIIDQVDAQNDLTSAQTGLTNALVDQQIALLEFWSSLGILYVKENGMWEDVDDV
jgi:outer membrane protein TolC